MEGVCESTVGGADPQYQYGDSYPRRRADTRRRRPVSHRIRLAARRYAEEHPGEVPCRTHRLQGVACRFAARDTDQITQPNGPTQNEIDRYEHDRQDRARLRHHAEHDFRQFVLYGRSFDPHTRYRGDLGPRGRAHRVSPSWGVETDVDDGLALARSRVSLPSDSHRHPQRCPSLEREEAFCDPKTFKGKVRVKRMPHVTNTEDDAQIADLYRMGLLYDDGEQLQRSDASFGLNDIHHDEPVYSIRPARRGRRTNSNNKSWGYDGPLPLNLSFADLGDDSDLAQFLASSSEAPATAGDDSLQHSSRRASRTTSVPLRVIYELATSRPSFDVDTSQPPDLMNDSLSDDYDCFSDSDLDGDADGDGDTHMPSQREVYDATIPANSTSGPWVLLGDDS